MKVKLTEEGSIILEPQGISVINEKLIRDEDVIETFLKQILSESEWKELKYKKQDFSCYSAQTKVELDIYISVVDTFPYYFPYDDSARNSIKSVVLTFLSLK